MKLRNFKYPFDPSLKHHLLIALGLFVWIFGFLYLTEPLDVKEFGDNEKLIYLPGYGIVGGLMYLLLLPFQYFLYKKNQQRWFILQEIIFVLSLILVSIVIVRFFYLYVVMVGEQNPYSFFYQLKAITLPAIAIILPIVIVGRFSFGKYKEKKLEQSKIEIKGQGTYDGLRLFLQDLICIQSSDNYVEIFYYSGKDIKKSLIRNKLSTLADEIPELLRVHRSYIINPYHFQQWKTENGKLLAELSSSIFVPISNTYRKEVKSILNSTTNS